MRLTKEDKELLLQNIAFRLPYKVKCNIGDDQIYTISTLEIDDDNGHLITMVETKNGLKMQVYLSEIKLYLIPKTTENIQMFDYDYNKLIEAATYDLVYDTDNAFYHEMAFFGKYHIDASGLIEKGLAIDASNLNIY